MKKKAIVIGAGIVGLAVSRALAVRGHQVDVYDRSAFAVGASIRNFGMIRPIGQTSGEMYERAMRSRSIWVEISNESGIWHDPVGSIHLAYSDLEMDVLEKFYQSVKIERSYTLLKPYQILKQSPVVNSATLKGGLFSPDEVIVDAPLATASLAQFFHEKYGVKFHWQKHVIKVETQKVYLSHTVIEADEIYVCNGPDFENLFPEVFTENIITKCKLQMMKTKVQPLNWRMGPSLCGGLSLTHYQSFQAAGDILNELKRHFKQSMSSYVDWGIHVMVSQNSQGELIIGDSHEYGPTHDPFDKSIINQLILDYLYGFCKFPVNGISATWNGVYPKLKNGATELVVSPLPGVTIVNGLGGAGMTLSFGLAEHILNK